MLTTDQCLLALGAELADTHKGDAVSEGSHPLNGKLSLSFSGAVEQLPALMVTPNLTLSLPIVLALLAQAGVKADLLTKIVIAAAQQAAAEKDGSATGEHIDLWSGHIKEARAKILETLDKVPKKGSLRRILTISDVVVEGTGLILTAPIPQQKKGRRKSAPRFGTF